MSVRSRSRVLLPLPDLRATGVRPWRLRWLPGPPSFPGDAAPPCGRTALARTLTVLAALLTRLAGLAGLPSLVLLALPTLCALLVALPVLLILAVTLLLLLVGLLLLARVFLLLRATGLVVLVHVVFVAHRSSFRLSWDAAPTGPLSQKARAANGFGLALSKLCA